jgi:hypothetical protein
LRDSLAAFLACSIVGNVIFMHFLSLIDPPS